MLKHNLEPTENLGAGGRRRGSRKDKEAVRDEQGQNQNAGVDGEAKGKSVADGKQRKLSPLRLSISNNQARPRRRRCRLWCHGAAVGLFHAHFRPPLALPSSRHAFIHPSSSCHSRWCPPPGSPCVFPRLTPRKAGGCRRFLLPLGVRVLPPALQALYSRLWIGCAPAPPRPARVVAGGWFVSGGPRGRWSRRYTGAWYRTLTQRIAVRPLPNYRVGAEKGQRSGTNVSNCLRLLRGGTHTRARAVTERSTMASRLLRVVGISPPALALPPPPSPALRCPTSL